MIPITAASFVVVAFACLLLWLLRPHRHTSGSTHKLLDQEMDQCLPRHYRFFPQVRQALSDRDEQYLRNVASPHVAKKALRERREVARHFLLGLREDFLKLERLARLVTALSPVISREQEAERLMLSLRFRVLYLLLRLRLSTGPVRVQHLEHLTGLVGRFALRMEEAMAKINALSVEQLPGGLSV